MRGSWIAGPDVRPPSELRLLCFAHAGGGASFFRPWMAALGPEIDVCPVVLPGRESRLRELPYVRIEQVIDPLTEALLPYLDRPFALFGHSMGAVLAYEVARRFHSRGLEPRRLLVSARRAPHLPARRRAFFDRPDDEFLAAVVALGGTPDDLLAQGDLVKLFLPCLRADFELNDTYAPLPGPRLTCPISASVGDADGEADVDEVEAWRDVTSGSFSLRVYDGDHFYLSGPRPELIAAIRQDLLGSQESGAPRPVLQTRQVTA